MYQAALSAAVVGGLGLWLNCCGPASSLIGTDLGHPSSGSSLVVLRLSSDEPFYTGQWGLRTYETRLVEELAKEKKWQLNWRSVKTVEEAEELLLQGRAHFFVTMGEVAHFSELVATQSYRQAQIVKICLPKTEVLEGECRMVDQLWAQEVRRFQPTAKIERGSTHSPVSWWVPPQSLVLDELNEWVTLRAPIHTRDLHTRHLKGFVDFQVYESLKFFERTKTRLPRFLALFESASAETQIDWKWLAALSYQESHWDTEAVSPTGVRGLMMLTQATAREMGVIDRKNPEQAILGGARYLMQIQARLPKYIKDDHRWFFTLAAYNVGFAHLKDAMALTVLDGQNPSDWYEVMSHLPKLSQPKYFKTTRYGFARGKEPVHFVNRIRNYYDLLCHSEANRSLRMASRVD